MKNVSFAKTVLILFLGIGRIEESLAQRPIEKLSTIEVFNQDNEQGLVDFIPSATLLKGHQLNHKRQTSLSDTLQSEPGVSSSSYGPVAGRPVIRGLDGDRIRILQNGLGTLDASAQSFDHAIPVDMLTVEQVEVVRGPMGLLYGSSAVGGVVNLVTNRIHSTFEEGFFDEFLIQGETVNHGVSSALHLNYGARQWMFHVDGSTRNLGNQRIPRYARSANSRQESTGEEEVKDKLPNSFNQQDQLALGVSHFFNKGYVGLSFNHLTSEYGTVADEEVTIDMTQNRYELHGEWRLQQNWPKKIKLRSVYSQYRHQEIEEDEVGTTFSNEGHESRLEAITASGRTHGVWGLQTQVFDFKAVGEEAFLPPSFNRKLALFVYQKHELTENQDLSWGARVEDSVVEKDSTETFGEKEKRSFLGLNASLGHLYRFNAENSLSTSFSYTERAPNFQELYARGPHLASGVFELGSPNFHEEKAYAFEVGFKNQGLKTQVGANLYTQVFHSYLALSPTGEDEDGLPVHEYQNVDALFYGGELQARQVVNEWSKKSLWLFGQVDWVRGKNTDDGHNLPRMAPPRALLGLELASDKYSAEAEVQYVAHQTKTAPLERRTDDYYMTNLYFTRHFIYDQSAFHLFFKVRNVFDVEARNHVSTLKEVAPLPGRNVVVGIRAQL